MAAEASWSKCSRADFATQSYGRRGEARLARPDDLEKFDLEDECRAAGNRRIALISIGEVRGADQSGLSANLHLLQALGPASNDSPDRELGRLVSLVGVVELRSIDQGSAIVHPDRVGGARRGPGAGRHLPKDQTGGGLHGPCFRGSPCEVRDGRRFLFIQPKGGAAIDNDAATVIVNWRAQGGK